MPLKVLVVDDSATNRRIVNVFLNKLGQDVALAENGAQAVELFQRDSFDLVLMDVMMPVMDGYEATRRIKALCGERWVPVIFLSALDTEDNLIAGLDAGGDDYLPKPINFVVLQAKLRSLRRAIEAHRRLAEAHLWLQTVTDTIVDAVITIDTAGLIRSVNAASEQIFGYTAQELLGRNVNMLMPEPWASTHNDHIRRYVHGGEPHIIGIGQRKVEARRKDGSVFPIELGVGEARINDERVFIGVLRDITRRHHDERQLKEAVTRLQAYHAHQEAENALAADILSRQLTRDGLADPALASWVAPAATVSGDVIAAARAPGGDLYVLLADATGHGLAASISTLPLLTLFYEMVDWGMALPAIVARINDQLCQALPSSRFVAAGVVAIYANEGRADVWLGGLPPLLQLAADGTVMRTLDSSRLPLGVVPFEGDMSQVDSIDLPPGCQLVLLSDGLIEATNDAGDAFGMARLQATLAAAPAGRRIEAVQRALRLHLGESDPHDDVTLLLVSGAPVD
ncbi:MAG: SpoIIE family protein phosphatase [Gammaproteobacteria bacterium]|nr:SpoIIE family protein phosphatase [Gammaproteobacteria bacterium]